jgi:hypothetical protein
MAESKSTALPLGYAPMLAGGYPRFTILRLAVRGAGFNSIAEFISMQRYFVKFYEIDVG